MIVPVFQARGQGETDFECSLGPDQGLHGVERGEGRPLDPLWGEKPHHGL